MPVYFVDSSALVKRYVAEPGTGWVQSLSSGTNSIVIASVGAVEVVAAISRCVRTAGPAVVTPIVQSFRLDLLSDFEIIETDAALIERAMDLAHRHALRGYDAVQLSAAIAARSALTTGLSLTLVSADIDLNSAAASEGFAVEDPNAHP